jgi:hypothetical protein
MTKDESIEKTLREAGIFPPSVQDSHCGDKTEMTREKIIEKTRREMSLFSSSEQGSQSSDEAGRLSTVIAELRRRLPDGEITTCGAFSLLNVGCCDVCHTDPLHGMKLVELPGCSWAWLCCAVDAASSPVPYPIVHEREEDSLGGKMQTCKYRNGRGRED